MNLFCFGLGYSALATGRWLRRMQDESFSWAGTVRGVDKGRALAEQGIAVHLFDGNAPSPTAAADIGAATHVLISVPPRPPADPVLVHHRADLDAAEKLEWLGYFSSVGVYGDAGGDWIDENAECRPTSDRSRARLAAETKWREYAAGRGLPICVMRLAGIYGAGRSALDKLREGIARRVVKPGQVFNRIHVEDIGRIAARAAVAGLDGVFNLADDEPAPPQDVVEYAAELIAAPVPPAVPLDEAELSEMARSFYADNRRCSNTAIKQALDVDLMYPTYREGLKAILKQTG